VGPVGLGRRHWERGYIGSIRSHCLYTSYKADIHAYVMVMQNRELCRPLRRADNRIAELHVLRASR
jgi:hypothetical protein